MKEILLNTNAALICDASSLVKFADCDVETSLSDSCVVPDEISDCSTIISNNIASTCRSNASIFVVVSASESTRAIKSDSIFDTAVVKSCTVTSIISFRFVEKTNGPAPPMGTVFDSKNHGGVAVELMDCSTNLIAASP